MEKCSLFVLSRGSFMQWLEVPFLIGVITMLVAKFSELDKRMDSITERLVRIETILTEIPKRRTDYGDSSSG